MIEDKRIHRTPEEIMQLVDRKQGEASELRTRMEEDYALYTLQPFVEIDQEGRPVKGFLTYTSNEPQVFADRIKAWISASRLIVRIPMENKKRQERAEDALMEKFVTGVLNVVDERLESRQQGNLRGQLAWYNVIRGYMAARAVMYKDPTDEFTTIIDVQPWDPIDTTWQTGRDGLLWACRTVDMTAEEIIAEWDVSYDDLGVAEPSGDTLFRVYDYFDAKENIVFTNSIILKPWTLHGDEQTPVVIKAVGDDPVIHRKDTPNPLLHVGESVFKSLRDVYRRHNLLMSIYLELVARQRDPSFKVFSQDGSKELKENPYIRRSGVNLAVGEEIKPFESVETTKDAAILTGLVSGEMQRGSLPHSIYGELQQALSGFAIKTLRQGLDAVINQRISAMNSMYRRIVQTLTRQYLSGAFPPLTLSGTDRENLYFSSLMEPALLSQARTPEITLVSILPEDDLAMLQQAQLARQPGPSGQPLFDDRSIHDRLLKTQDPDSIINAIRQQMFELGSPEAAAYTAMMAAADQGEKQYGDMAMWNLQIIMMQKLLATIQGKQQLAALQGAPPAGQPPPNGQQPKPPGMNNAVLPQEMFGINETPTPQAGPNVPPGTPRPGARQAPEAMPQGGA